MSLSKGPEQVDGLSLELSPKQLSPEGHQAQEARTEQEKTRRLWSRADRPRAGVARVICQYGSERVLRRSVKAHGGERRREAEICRNRDGIGARRTSANKPIDYLSMVSRNQPNIYGVGEIIFDPAV